MDTCGPFPIATLYGKKYFTTVLNNCSNFAFTNLGAQKSDAINSYLSMEAYVEWVSEQKVLSICIDNAPEFIAGCLGTHFKDWGIMVQAIVMPKMERSNGISILLKMDYKHFLQTLAFWLHSGVMLCLQYSIYATNFLHLLYQPALFHLKHSIKRNQTYHTCTYGVASAL